MPAMVKGFNHHGITVSDIERSLGFFVGVLGLERGPVIDLDDQFSAGVTGVAGARIRVAFVHGPGFDIELLQYLSPVGRRPVLAAPCDVGSVHLALFVDDIDAVVAGGGPDWHLAGSIQPITVGPRAGGRAAYLRDVEGTLVELVEAPRAGGPGHGVTAQDT